MNRFALRRLTLERRGMCTHCGNEPRKPGCRWGVQCLAVESAKRDIKADPERSRRRAAKILQKRELLSRALDMTRMPHEPSLST